MKLPQIWADVLDFVADWEYSDTLLDNTNNYEIMSKHLLVFQHTDWEGPGEFFFRAAGKSKVDLTIIKLWKEKIPPLSGYDALIVLGGKPNVHQENEYPFLKKEKQAIKKSIKEDRPYLGVCLGHQLLAESLGATIGDNYCASIGFVEGFLTRKARGHPLFGKIPQKFPLFKWHCQSVIEPVPRNMDILVTSSECQVEAISIKGRPHIVGVQFDNNSSYLDDVLTYLRKEEKWLLSLNGKFIKPEVIINGAKKYQDMLAQQYDILFTNFISMT